MRSTGHGDVIPFVDLSTLSLAQTYKGKREAHGQEDDLSNVIGSMCIS
jgi:hypothetical protein